MPDAFAPPTQGDPIRYRDGELVVEDTPLAGVAKQFATPAYVYSQRAFSEHYAELAGAFAPLSPRICYSIKSCHNLHILRLMLAQGASFDAVSIGEVRRALEAGALSEHIVFAGVGKTRTEIVEAVRLGVGCFNVESSGELEVLAKVAQQAPTPVRAALRVNPDVDPKTHVYTTTGKKENKFGIPFAEARTLFHEYRAQSNLHLTGVHVHIGSPVNTVKPYIQAVTRTLELVDELRGGGIEIDFFNLGGGWGTDYGDGASAPLQAYADALVALLRGKHLDIHMEPGRCIAANAGVLLTSVVYVKQGEGRRFIIVDAAMTDLIRPALYQAYHFLWPVCPGETRVPTGRGPQQRLPGLVEVDVVGPVCESGDFLAKQRPLPPLKPGDLLAVFSAGAYASVMSSQYNSRPRAPEVLIEGSNARLIRRRETYDDLVRHERGI